MKGIVFTEFLEFVEREFGDDTADEILEGAELASGGAYTAVGTYDPVELVRLVAGLAAVQDAQVSSLLRAFGRALLGRFTLSHPQFFEQAPDAFTFLAGVDRHIHSEVRKLYPEAELPVFEAARPEPGVLVLDYRSSRALADLAEGLIGGCLEQFGEDAELEADDLSGGARTHVRFTLRRG